MSVFNIGFWSLPENLTQLDFTGPLQVLNRLPQSATHIIAKTREPVPSDCGLEPGADARPLPTARRST